MGYYVGRCLATEYHFLNLAAIFQSEYHC